MQINVRGGTHAGWRIVKAAVRRDWRCGNCGALNRYYWAKCPVCSRPRDEDA